MVTKILAARQEAKNERRFDVADALRDALDSAGIDIHDGPNESTWSIRG
jgi:cysteinyl-tRNA synthetase